MVEVRRFIDGHIKSVPEESSRLFHHWNSRNQHGDAHRETGTFPRLMIQQAGILGHPPESLWPYLPWKLFHGEPMWKQKPRLLAYQHASADRGRISKLAPWNQG